MRTFRFHAQSSARLTVKHHSGLIHCRTRAFQNVRRPSARGEVINQATTPGSSAPPEYEVLLIVLSKLRGKGTSQDLKAFIRGRDTCTSISFIQWVADKEKRAEDPGRKQELADICEQLVVVREGQEEDSLITLHQDVTRALQDGGPTNQSRALQLRDNPATFAVALSETITGSPVLTEGYSPVHDLILQASPPMALTPQGLKEGFAKAAQLAEEVKVRKKRVLAAHLGRVQLEAAETDAILAGPPAARVLDFLLQLPTSAERMATLPECFTPPEEDEEAEDEEQELLWCTPAQLLAEVERRLAPSLQGSVPGAAASLPGAVSQLQLAAPGGLQQESMAAALQELRAQVKQHWMLSLPPSPPGSQQ